jgi:hypothetical protein
LMHRERLLAMSSPSGREKPAMSVIGSATRRRFVLISAKPVTTRFESGAIARGPGRGLVKGRRFREAALGECRSTEVLAGTAANIGLRAGEGRSPTPYREIVRAEIVRRERAAAWIELAK